MAVPTPKSPEVEGLLEGFSGRTTAVTSNRCVDFPVGCGGPAIKFDDELSRKEYSLSGLCQVCQDMFFGSEGGD